MAGGDKKQQRLESSESGFAGQAEPKESETSKKAEPKDSQSDDTKPLVVEDPIVAHFVIAGDTTGLIPRVNLDVDQTTTIATWANPIVRTEKFRLKIARKGSDEWTTLKEHEVDQADTWAPLVFTIPSTFFLHKDNEGPFDLMYEHENIGAVKDYSGRVAINIDKVPPNGATPPTKMSFTITPPITDATFALADHIEGTIPPWSGDQADVKVRYGWFKGELPEDPADMELTDPIPVVPGQKVQITKVMIEKAGDGKGTGGYVLIDKAGNWNISNFELMSVALGPLPPAPLPAPKATDATGGELLRSDVVDDAVLVNVPHITNGKKTDTVVVTWKDQEITPGTPVGSNPSSGINIPVPWANIWAAYGSATTGAVDQALTYTVLRGVEPFDSTAGTVKVNLSGPGPVIDPPTPEPGNDQLEPVEIIGKSGTPNVLIDTDENQEINASIKLVAPLVDGDTYKVMWNGTPIGAPYVINIANDSAGETIEIALDWDDIRLHGPSATMPVWYVLTNAAHANPQEPDPRTSVDIDFLTISFPQAEAQTDHATGMLTCNHLRANAAGTDWGFEYKIPESTHLKAGDEVKVEWNGYTDFDNPVLVSGAYKTHTFTQYEASRSYTYMLVDAVGKQAEQTACDVKGVTTTTRLDGFNRVIEEFRQDADAVDPEKRAGVRNIYEATYDNREQLETETVIDWESDKNVHLISRFKYDDWPK